MARSSKTAEVTIPRDASHELRVERWPLDELIPYARNARTHSDEQVAQIAASIKEFGFVNPIPAGSDRVIIAGHARLLAARKIGLTEVPVIVIDGLNENQRRALVLADNKLAMPGGMRKCFVLRSRLFRMPNTISTSSASRTMNSHCCSRSRKLRPG